MSTRIIKVGGSLLDWPALPQALRSWLDEQPLARNILLCGGGAVVDAVRQTDRNFELGDEAAHWLAIDGLAVTARLLGTILNVPVLTTYDDLTSQRHDKDAGCLVFDPREFLRNRETHLPGPKLPHDWSVTSDSIAARLAVALSADELALLKSSDPPAASLAELAATGHVDRCFPIAARRIRRVRFVNLRNEGITLAARMGTLICTDPG
jgi:aspartokinase-like uncharacterized kinase